MKVVFETFWKASHSFDKVVDSCVQFFQFVHRFMRSCVELFGLVSSCVTLCTDVWNIRSVVKCLCWFVCKKLCWVFLVFYILSLYNLWSFMKCSKVMWIFDSFVVKFCKVSYSCIKLYNVCVVFCVSCVYAVNVYRVWVTKFPNFSEAMWIVKFCYVLFRAVVYSCVDVVYIL